MKSIVLWSVGGVVLMSSLGCGGLITEGFITATNEYDEGSVETTRLVLMDVEQRVALYSLKNKLPSTGEGLKAVYGGMTPPTDSWNNEFIYVSPGPDGRQYDIISYGADGQEGGSGYDADIKFSETR